MTKRYLKQQNEQGIALLLVLLAMSVVLVMVMQIVSSSITDIDISTTEEEASRAFSAAEAGIERILLESSVGSINNVPLDNNSTFSATVESTGGGRRYHYPKKLSSGESATFWLVSHNDDDSLDCTPPLLCYTGGSINLYWGEGQDPAVEVTIYYDTNSNPSTNYLSGNFSGVRVQRYVYDPVASRRSTNKFALASIGTYPKLDSFGVERIYKNSVSGISLPGSSGNNIMVRVRPLYLDLSAGETTYIGIEGSGANDLPHQLKVARAVGQAGGEGDRAVRSVQAFQTYPEPLSIFDAALVSPQDIVKN